MKTKIKFLFATLMLFCIAQVNAQNNCNKICGANAGADKTSTCPGNCVSIGVSGCGTAPSGASCSGAMAYSWAPGGMTTCTPTVCPTVTTNYTLYVTFTCGSTALADCCCDGCGGTTCGSGTANPCNGTVVRNDIMKVTVNNTGCRLINPESTPLVENADVSIFPNPSNGNISLKFSKINPGTCILFYDSNGKLVKEENNIDENNLNRDYDFSSLAKGIYYVRVIEGENTFYLNKIVLQ